MHTLEKTEVNLIALKEKAAEQLQQIALHFKQFQSQLLRKGKQLFLFAIDEARALTEANSGNSFDVFRYMLLELAMDSSSCPENREVDYFGLLIDTYGNFDHFKVKERPKDSSLRKMTLAQNKEFPPVSILQFRRDDVRLWWKATDFENEKQILEELLMNQGRFLWKAFRQNSMIEANIEFGAMKLLGGRTMKSQSVKEDQLPISMALLGCRVAVAFPCTEKYVSDMVSSYMGVCYYMNPCEDYLLYGYPSEPLLSLSAAYLMNESLFSWTCCLERIESFFRRGLVGAGVRGEFICRVLLSMAWDSCQNSQIPMHAPTNVSRFLESLGGDRLLAVFQERGTKKKQREILDGRLYFTHFVYIDYEVNQGWMLERFLSCGQAVICRNDQQAIDLLIPIVLSDNKSVSFIGIQCKNRNQISWSDAENKYDARKMGFGPAFKSPYIVLCMQVGRGGTPAITNLMPSNSKMAGTKNIIAMNGLDKVVFPLLGKGDGLQQVLEHFQVSWEDPLSYLEREKGRGLEEKLLKTVMEPTYGWSAGDPMDVD